MAEDNIYAFFNSISPTSTYKVPVFEKERNKDWVKYGEDNLYPQYLCDLFNRSAKHNAILVAKQKYTFGQGIKIKKDAPNPIEAQRLLMRPNKFENLNSLYKKIELDKWLYGGYCLQIVWSKASGKVAEFYHMDFAKVRSNVDNTEFYYSENWADYRPKVATFKAFDSERPEGVQLLYVRDYRPNISTYPLPDYIGAIPYIECDTDVANFHRANLQNNFFFGGILNFNNGTPTPQEQTELVRRINRRHGTTDNAGRWIINFSDGQDRAPNVITLQPSDLDKQFDILNKTIQEEIFVAHRVTSPMFFGIRVEGQLGGRSEMIDSFKLFEQNEIKPVQEHFEQFFNYIATINGIGQPFEILPLQPFSPEFSESTLLEIATKDELRGMAGLQVSDVIDQNNKIVDRLTLFSPLISNKILESLTKDEIRGLAGIQKLDPNETVVGQEFSDWQSEIKVFSEFGESADKFDELHTTYLDLFEHIEDKEARQHAFNEQLESIEQDYYQFIEALTEQEKKIIDLIKKDPFIAQASIASELSISADEVEKIIKTLREKSVITKTEGAWNVILKTPPKSLINRIGDEIDKFDVRYRYTGPKDSRNREFCAALLDLNKLYTRKDIDTISERVNRNVWTKRGGWQTVKGTDIHLPYCRHTWASILVRKK